MSSGRKEELFETMFIKDFILDTIDKMVRYDNDTAELEAQLPGGNVKFTIKWDNMKELHDELMPKPPMTVREAWEILEEHLPTDAGYEACEYDEMKETIETYNKAWEIVNSHITGDE